MSVLGAVGNFFSGGEGHTPLHYGYDESKYDPHRQGQAGVRDDQQWLSSQYQNMITGQGPSVAQNQLREATAENQRMGMAMARSGTGPMAGGAQYAAMRNNAATQQAANRQAATLRAQEVAGAMQGMGAHTGNVRGQDISMLQTEQGYQTDKAGIHAGVEGAKSTAAEEYAKRKGGASMFTLGAGAAIMGGLVSDERMKTGLAQGEWGSRRPGENVYSADPAHDTWASAQAPDMWASAPRSMSQQDAAAAQFGSDLAHGPSMLDMARTDSYGMPPSNESFGVPMSPRRNAGPLIGSPEDDGLTAWERGADKGIFSQDGVLAPIPTTEMTPTARKGKEPWRWASSKGTADVIERMKKSGVSGEDDKFSQGLSFGQALSGLMSDVNTKEPLYSDRNDKRPGQVSGGEIDTFLSDLEPYKYKYKEGVPGEDPGRPYVGVMAQDVDKSRVGGTLVREDPQSGMKMLDTKHGFGTTLAALGRLNERIAKLEGRKGRA